MEAGGLCVSSLWSSLDLVGWWKAVGILKGRIILQPFDALSGRIRATKCTGGRGCLRQATCGIKASPTQTGTRGGCVCVGVGVEIERVNE